ncbi:MAG: hypothetical protein IJY25_01210 [Bacilli bacterium]|nr:hypothetical protein [Bacilli bacterium]
MNNDIDAKDMANDFADIDKKDTSKNYIVIVVILYILVISLTIFLVLGIKNQKKEIPNNIQNNEIKLNR